MLTKYTLFISLIFILACRSHNDKSAVPSEATDSAVQVAGICVIENHDLTMVTAPCDGKIVYIYTENGSQVKAGKTIARIENVDLLLLQKEYLEANNEMELCSREYARQGDLTVDNATSLKKMETAKHDYQAAGLRYKSLRKQLILLGIQPDSITSENLQARLSVRSPIDGIVTSSPSAMGYFVKKGDPIFEIARSQELLIQLEIPEASIWQIQKNQKIVFNPVSDTSLTMEAYVYLTPKAVDPVKHTAIVVAKPLSANSNLLPGMSVKAFIYPRNSKQ